MNQSSKTNEIQIGDSLWHAIPQVGDIVEYKIVEIVRFESKNLTIVTIKSVKAVGRRNRILELSYKNGVLQYIPSDDEDGIGDWHEGKYFSSFSEARLDYYCQIVTQAHSNLEEQERRFNDAREKYTQIVSIMKLLREEIGGSPTLKELVYR